MEYIRRFVLEGEILNGVCLSVVIDTDNCGCQISDSIIYYNNKLIDYHETYEYAWDPDNICIERHAYSYRIISNTAFIPELDKKLKDFNDMEVLVKEAINVVESNIPHYNFDGFGMPKDGKLIKYKGYFFVISDNQVNIFFPLLKSMYDAWIEGRENCKVLDESWGHSLTKDQSEALKLVLGTSEISYKVEKE